LLNIAVAIYGVVLSVMAVKAVSQFGWARATASSLAVFIFVAVPVTVILVLVGPIIGHVFIHYVEGISDTPLPSPEPGGIVLPFAQLDRAGRDPLRELARCSP
jgi:putative Mn2+ efflux pump MntP